MQVGQNFKIYIFLGAFFMQACASVELSSKPANAVQLRGVVVDVSAVGYAGLSAGQYGAAIASGGYVGVGLASVIDSKIGNKAVTTVQVVVSDKLSLTMPANKSFKAGECVDLFIDPLYRELLERKDTPNMSLPVNSVYIQNRSC